MKRWKKKAYLTSVYKTYLRSPLWQAKRQQALAHAGYRCAARRSVTPCRGPLQVHHLAYPAVLGQEALADLQVLCKRHHQARHAKMDKGRRKRKKTAKQGRQ